MGRHSSPGAFKGRWRLGRGFERFYGYLGGESNSWYPDLIHDNHPIEPPARPEDGYHLSKDLSDRAIGFIRDGKVINPGDGICVGRDGGSAVTPEYVAPFRFTGGTIDKVVVDVSGDPYVDHEAQVRGWFAIDSRRDRRVGPADADVGSAMAADAPVAFVGKGRGDNTDTAVPAPATPAQRPPAAPCNFHVLAKPSGPICNLDCQYCFFLEKEALYPGDRFRMSDEVVDAYVRQLLEAHADPEVTVAWQGGEPTLMGVGFFRRALRACERHRRPGQRLIHTIQTNGTLLTDEFCRLFAENDFLVGISVDGPPELHDAYRVDKRGNPTFAKVLRGLDLLKAHGVEWNVLCTVHAANEDHPLDVYRFFRDELGARHIQLIPIVEREKGEGEAGVTGRTVSPEGWGRFLGAVFDEWVRRDVGTVFVSQFDAALASWSGVRPALCIFNETCGNALALEHNGDVYSCDHFVDPEYLLGNITETHMVELVASPAQRAFGDAKRDTLPGQCRRCDVRFACHGECPKNRFTVTADGETGLNYLCAGYLEFFHHVDGPMRLMAELLRRGRYADEIMGIFAAAGRNDPCPCGSDRKAKQCHQRPVRT